MRKIAIWFFVALAALYVGVIIAGSCYMLQFSLAPDPTRANTDSCYRQLFDDYPETRPWVDSLRLHAALRDTFLVMPTGGRAHAYYVDRGSNRTAVVIHGWRDQAIKFFYLARMYEREFGYNVVMPDLHACGQSDGEAIRMGWLDRLDVLRWLEAFRTDTMVVHGVSMGGATTMMLAGETMPDGIRDMRFVEDCGYTCVWDEFAGELKAQFGLSEFPLMYSTSLLCRLRYGWSFGQASALAQVRQCRYPMLFIHGDSDTFVPTWMVRSLFNAKPDPKELWITTDTDHASSYRNHREEYIGRVGRFLTIQ